MAEGLLTSCATFPLVSTILVTGANRGIGLELVKQLKERGDEVIAICRKSSDELEAVGVRVEAGIDVATDAAERITVRLGGTKLDGVIHNAGVLRVDNLDGLDLDEVRMQLEVNALGPLRVTRALLSHLDEGSKIAIITSRMGSLADNTSGGMYGYRMSKAAVNMAAVSLAQDLRDRGIAVGLLHPGYVRTEMTGNNGNVEPADSARDLLARFDELDMAKTGTFRHANGEPLPW